MEIIVRLREEREALVARVTKIDEMLRQYEEWGREAQQLISVDKYLPTYAPTPAVEQFNADASMSTPSDNAVDDGPSSREREDNIKRVSTSSQQKKTPMKEFEAAVLAVLHDARGPLDRVALYEALTARNIVIGDGDRDKVLNSLSARLYRMAQDSSNGIVSERGQGYSLRTLDVEPDMGSSDGVSPSDTNLDDLLQ